MVKPHLCLPRLVLAIPCVERTIAMHFFWDITIRPILKHLQPATIVEVGSDRGYTTQKLLSYCQQNLACLHVVDPLPKYDVEEWKQRYGDRVVFHQELSLNALPSIPSGDLVLIDGDHNWYTVFNELKLIEKRCQAEQRPFPVILLHDIDWPYGRRDLYYNPENIPPRYRHAHKQQGLRLDSPSLVETGGFNAHLYHSIYENQLQNGVRTAVEDFISESKQSLYFHGVPGFHGFGILVTDRCQQEYPELGEFLESLKTSTEVESLVKALEKQRLEGVVKNQRYKQEAARLREQIENLQRASLSESSRYEREVAELKAQIESLQQANRSKTSRQEVKIAELERQVDSLKQANQANASEDSRYEQEFAVLEERQRNGVNRYEKEAEEFQKRIKSPQQTNVCKSSGYENKDTELEEDNVKGLQSTQSDVNGDERKARVRLELLKGKTWRYLRYLHTRQALGLMSDWKDVLIVGAGNGLAEIALALEFPNKLFHLTDYEGATHSFKHAKAFVKMFELGNVSFGGLNILKPEIRQFDVVYSVEVLEHIEDDARAALNMNQLSKRYVFCLVPFAQDALNDNVELRKRLYEEYEHFVAGYDAKKLVSLFPNPIAVRGCYWQDAGAIFRRKLTAMDVDAIEKEYEELIFEASKDLKNSVQTIQKDALGIWIVSETNPA